MPPQNYFINILHVDTFEDESPETTLARLVATVNIEPNRGQGHTVKYQIIAKAFICFNPRPGGNWAQAFNLFLSKIWDENVTNFASFSVCLRRTATGPGCLVEGGRRQARSLR